MYNVKYKEPDCEAIFIKIEDEKIELFMNSLNERKFIQIGNNFYKTNYFQKCEKIIKADNTLKLPEVQLTEEERLKNCEKLRKMKQNLFKC